MAQNYINFAFNHLLQEKVFRFAVCIFIALLRLAFPWYVSLSFPPLRFVSCFRGSFFLSDT